MEPGSVYSWRRNRHLPTLNSEKAVVRRFVPLASKTLNGSAVPLLALRCCDAASIQSRRDRANRSDALFSESLNRAWVKA